MNPVLREWGENSWRKRRRWKNQKNRIMAKHQWRDVSIWQKSWFNNSVSACRDNILLCITEATENPKMCDMPAVFHYKKTVIGKLSQSERISGDIYSLWVVIKGGTNTRPNPDTSGNRCARPDLRNPTRLSAKVLISRKTVYFILTVPFSLWAQSSWR